MPRFLFSFVQIVIIPFSFEIYFCVLMVYCGLSNNTFKLLLKKLIVVVYFNQRLGAAHSKRLWKESISTFLLQKTFKKARNFSKKQFFLSLDPNAGRVFYSPMKVKTCFYRKKSSFFGNKPVDQHSGANLKNPVFC